MPPHDDTDADDLRDAARRDVLNSINEVFDGDSRDPERIPELLSVLEEYWREHPDIRLGQLLTIMASDAGHGDGDPFYLEDSELERILRRRLEEDTDV